MFSAKELAKDFEIIGKYELNISIQSYGKSFLIEGMNRELWSADKFLNNQPQDERIIEFSDEDIDFLKSRNWFYDQEFHKWRKLIY